MTTRSVARRCGTDRCRYRHVEYALTELDAPGVAIRPLPSSIRTGHDRRSWPSARHPHARRKTGAVLVLGLIGAICSERQSEAALGSAARAWRAKKESEPRDLLDIAPSVRRQNLIAIGARRERTAASSQIDQTRKPAACFHQMGEEGAVVASVAMPVGTIMPARPFAPQVPANSSANSAYVLTLPRAVRSKAPADPRANSVASLRTCFVSLRTQRSTLRAADRSSRALVDCLLSRSAIQRQRSRASRVAKNSFSGSLIHFPRRIAQHHVEPAAPP